ncbi:hypothetical protein K438DRAFT_1818879 [Mycena galopus ATCC 62051]|nr:hypothetical protein K438DRAFT_1818879 [Mycena galopus ATCC 62051]
MPRQPTVPETSLERIKTGLTLALPLLSELNDAFGPPFVQSIANTIQTLINLIQNVKQNKNECAQLMDSIHEVLYPIVELHIKSETIGSLPPAMLHNIGKFMETLHKIYIFIEAQQQRNKIKNFFRNNEMNKLLQDCYAGLKQAKEVFGIQTQTQTLNDIRDFKETANLLHKELMKSIENHSDTSTMSERSSVYLGTNESKNSSNSFSMLPSKPKIFHGREHELNHILKLISQQSPRIAILGGGGMGKTSLARAVLHHPDISSRFENKFFISAEAATTSIELAALVGLHVGLNPGQDLTNPLVEYFSRKKSCLVILDNLETVWEPIQSQAGVEEFLSLLTGIEHLALVITMRGAERPAKVQWSHPFLPPLSPLSNNAARQTFIEITDNSNTMEEMDQLLGFTDNMPLAVDLIAHLADYEGCSNVLSRWKTEKTSLLSVGFDRRSSLGVSISLSLSSPRITPDGKELLSLLSILPNGLSDTELVHGNLGITNILSCKTALQATSLAYWDNNQRLVLLTPIREYIQQILPPSLSSLQRIHAYFYTVLELLGKFRGMQLEPVIKQITLNLANLQEVLQRGLHMHTPILADTIQCTISLNRFYRATQRGHFSLLNNIQSLLSPFCDQQLETMLLTELLHTRQYWPDVSQEMIAQAIMHLDHTRDPVLCSKFYNAAGNYLFGKGKVQEATQYLHKALEMSELSRDRTEQCNVLIELGWLKWNTGNYSAGNAYATAAQRLSKLSANLYGEAHATILEASCLRFLGNYNLGAELHRASELLHICGMSGGTLDQEIRLEQAEIHRSKSEYAEARSIFCQVIETTSAEKNAYCCVDALFNIGLIDMIIGKTQEDIFKKLKTAQEIVLQDNGFHGIIICEMIQAIMEFMKQRFDSAKLKFQECLYLSWEKAPEIGSLCLEQLANMAVWPISARQYHWAMLYLVFAQKSKGKLDLHKAFLFVGDIFIITKDENTATSLYQAALEGFTDMDVHQSRAQCMLRLGDLANKHQCTSEAISFWKAARPLFERSLQTKDVAQIDSRLSTCHL